MSRYPTATVKRTARNRGTLICEDGRDRYTCTVTSSAAIFKQSTGEKKGVEIGLSYRARICKRLWSPGIDSASLGNLGAVTPNRVVVPSRQAANRFLSSLKGLKNTGSGPSG
jgi:hypothetical protein